MQLNIRDVARFLKVSERTVYRWIDDEDIPNCRIGEEIRFNKAELLEWATLRKLPVARELLEETQNSGSFATALETGGVYYGIPGNDLPSVIHAMIGALELPETIDRQTLLDVLLSRDQAATAVGDGIAIPHVRQPVVLNVSKPFVALFFLECPLDLGASDGKPVGVFFFLVSSTVREHLQLLSRIALVIRDPAFRSVMTKQATAEELLREARRIEAKA
jgi:PTS system nitrogen regulatory IIA component